MTALLELDEVSVVYGGMVALDKVSLAVPAGCIQAVIGPNGAGKTTLVNAISGYVRLTSGNIRVAGKTLRGLPPHRVAAHGVRRTFQNGGVFGAMTVLENVVTGLHAPTLGHLAGIALGLPAARRAEEQAAAKAMALLEAMDVAHLADRPARELSFGQQRHVEIARALVGGARLLLLDEPAVGLSLVERERLGEQLCRLAAQGVGIILIEHVLDLVMAVSHQLAVLHLGAKIAEGAPQEIRNNAQVVEVYLGL